MHTTELNALLTTIERLCQKRQIRLTEQRKVVLRLLAQANGAISAYDLLDQLKEVEHQAKPPTIYRALDFLLQQGFIHKVESTNCYILCRHFADPLHTSVLFICVKCRQVSEQAAKNIESELSAIANAHQFKLQHSVVEVHGLCAQCQY